MPSRRSTPTPDAPDAPAPEARRELARARRLQVEAQARRAHVLAAAHEAFVELGLEGASLREIAKRAGYTPGAIYSYFDSKEAVYGALLAESLERLNAAMAAADDADDGDGPAGAAAADPAGALRHRARAFFEFYREHPRDLDLGFYLFHGLRPRGLTPALNEALNTRLRDALAPIEAALRALGWPAAEAGAELTALFAHSVGLLLLSHTGRIRMFGQASAELFERYLVQLLQRRPPLTPAS